RTLVTFHPQAHTCFARVIPVYPAFCDRHPAIGPRPVKDRCQIMTRDEASAREDAPARISILAHTYRGFVWFGGEYAQMATVNNNGRSGSSSRPAAQLVIGTPARVLFSLTLIAGLLAVVLNVA